ncbi:MAG: N-acetyltransferase [Phycisphaeraceae bacterium]|nr:N-acetyltransferase [Phycisphaeraceae bacterium]
MLIEAQRVEDSAAIHIMLERAFGRTVEAELVDQLREDGDLTLSLVAREGEQIIGHVGFSPILIDGRLQPDVLGLAPVAVDTDHQRRGIGARLVRAGLDACREGDYHVVIVFGDPRYYQRFGFQTASRFGLLNAYGATDAFMVVQLQPDALRGRVGMVRHARAFDAFV